MPRENPPTGTLAPALQTPSLRLGTGWQAGRNGLLDSWHSWMSLPLAPNILSLSTVFNEVWRKTQEFCGDNLAGMPKRTQVDRSDFPIRSLVKGRICNLSNAQSGAIGKSAIVG
jgi:hypothetical protein